MTDDYYSPPGSEQQPLPRALTWDEAEQFKTFWNESIAGRTPSQLERRGLQIRNDADIEGAAELDFAVNREDVHRLLFSIFVGCDWRAIPHDGAGFCRPMPDDAQVSGIAAWLRAVH